MSKKEYKKEMFRYDEKTGRFKRLTIKFVEDYALLVLEEGYKGGSTDNQIAIKLNQAEVAFLKMVLEKGFLKFF